MTRYGIRIILLSTLLIAAGGSLVWVLLHTPQKQTATPEQSASGQTLYQCPMHPEYISPQPGTCGICGMKLVPLTHRQSDSGIVQIDPHVVQTIGVRVDVLQPRILQKSIRAVGYVHIDESRIATVTVKVHGWVEHLFVRTTGEHLRKGEPMVEVYSPELLSAQEECVQALAYAERLQHAGADSAVLRSAQNGIAAARRRLELWDVPPEVLRKLEHTRQPQRTVILRAPFDGVVVERLVSDGSELRPGMPLFRLADLSQVWVVAEFYAPDLAWIRSGLPALLEFPSLPGKTYRGELFFVEPLADPASSTVRGRIRLPNPGGHLRPGMYAIVQLQVRTPRPVLAIPEDAVLRTGKRDVAIRALGQGRFQPVEVHLGAAWDGYYELLHGLRRGTRLSSRRSSSSTRRVSCGQDWHNLGTSTEAPPRSRPHPRNRSRLLRTPTTRNTPSRRRSPHNTPRQLTLSAAWKWTRARLCATAGADARTTSATPPTWRSLPAIPNASCSPTRETSNDCAHH